MSTQQQPKTNFRGEVYLINREVTVYSPPGHIMTLAYGATSVTEDDDQSSSIRTSLPQESFGQFTCTLLSAEIDDAGNIVSGTIEYPQGRKYLRRDHVSLKGCAISHKLERDDYVKSDAKIKAVGSASV